MIQPHRAQHRDVGVNDIGGIEPTAQPDFEHYRADTGVPKYLERRQRAVLEKGQRGRTACRLDPIERSQ
jgi:hypothetical protein